MKLKAKVSQIRNPIPSPDSEQPVRYVLSFPGHCPAKKSLYRRRRGGGLFLDDEVRGQISRLEWAAREQWGDRPPLNFCDDIVGHFYVLHYKADLDGKWATILDVLQKARVIRNDNMKVIGKSSQVAYKDGPERAVIEIFSPEDSLFEDRAAFMGSTR